MSENNGEGNFRVIQCKNLKELEELVKSINVSYYANRNSLVVVY